MPTPSRPNNDLLGIRDVSEALGVHYMTAYRYVRTGQLAAHLDGDQWKVRTQDLTDFLTTPKAKPGRRKPNHPNDAHVVFAPRLRGRMIAGDESGAWKIIESALASGASPKDVYLLMLAPSLNAIGDLWQQGTITVAEEHIASAIATRIIGRLGPRFATRGHRRGTIVLGSAPGDHHAIATAILADLVRGAGFHAIDLGPNTPAESFCNAVETVPKITLVGIGCNTNDATRSASFAIELLRQRQQFLGPVVIGGSAIRSQRTAVKAGADFWAKDGDEFLAIVTSAQSTSTRKSPVPRSETQGA